MIHVRFAAMLVISAFIAHYGTMPSPATVNHAEVCALRLRRSSRPSLREAQFALGGGGASFSRAATTAVVIS